MSAVAPFGCLREALCGESSSQYPRRPCNKPGRQTREVPAAYPNQYLSLGKSPVTGNWKPLQGYWITPARPGYCVPGHVLHSGPVVRVSAPFHGTGSFPRLLCLGPSWLLCLSYSGLQSAWTLHPETQTTQIIVPRTLAPLCVSSLL